MDDQRFSFGVLGYLNKQREYCAGVLMILLGAGSAWLGTTYKIGTLAKMGPGFMPVALGVILTFLGILIIFAQLVSTDEEPVADILPDNPQWFGWFCILAGPVLFIILGIFAGMVPAVFACVFVCALGDNTMTYKAAFYLALGVTIFGVLLFHVLLNVPFPLIRGLNL